MCFSEAIRFVINNYRSMFSNANGAVLTCSYDNAPIGDVSLQWYRPTDEPLFDQELLIQSDCLLIRMKTQNKERKQLDV